MPGRNSPANVSAICPLRVLSARLKRAVIAILATSRTFRRALPRRQTGPHSRLASASAAGACFKTVLPHADTSAPLAGRLCLWLLRRQMLLDACKEALQQRAGGRRQMIVRIAARHCLCAASRSNDIEAVSSRTKPCSCVLPARAGFCPRSFTRPSGPSGCRSRRQSPALGQTMFDLHALGWRKTPIAITPPVTRPRMIETLDSSTSHCGMVPS